MVKYLEKLDDTSTPIVDRVKSVVVGAYRDNTPNELEPVLAFDSSSNSTTRLRSLCPLIDNNENTNNNDDSRSSSSSGKINNLSSNGNNTRIGGKKKPNESTSNASFCSWLKENKYTIGLMFVFVVFLASFVVLLRLVLFKSNNNDYCTSKSLQIIFNFIAC